MLTDEKKIREENLRDLKCAQEQLLGRSSTPRSCFESIQRLNKAACNLLLEPEMNEDDIAALLEILLIQGSFIQAAYARYRLEN